MLNSKVISIIGGLPVSSNAKIIMLKFVDKQLEKKVIVPGYDVIGSWIGRGRSTVGYCLLELEHAGLIRRIRRGKKRTNLYEIASDIWSYICKNVPFKYWFKNSVKKTRKVVKKVREVVEETVKGYIQPYHPPAPKPVRTVSSTMEHSAALDFLETNYEEAIKPI